MALVARAATAADPALELARRVLLFDKWRKQGAWKQLWLRVGQHRCALDLSSIQLDGSHTPAKSGGVPIGYQGRKAAPTINAYF
ncbi:hypothetical protein GCM10027346_42450 [Hymenobacter seoulensis]